MLAFKECPLLQGGHNAGHFAKDLVVLHFTAGSTAEGAFSQWNKMLNGVSTPYIVDLDGTIWRTFSDDLWSYHLGEASEGHRNHKRSVAIEIANPGPLRTTPLDMQTLHMWPKNFTTKFCGLNETDKYVKSDFRGEKYFAAFTAAQIAATVELVSDICGRFDIPKVIPTTKLRFDADVSSYRNFKGVCSHVNFRRDKTDLAPAQSDPIWNGLLAQGFTAA